MIARLKSLTSVNRYSLNKIGIYCPTWLLAEKFQQIDKRPLLLELPKDKKMRE